MASLEYERSHDPQIPQVVPPLPRARRIRRGGVGGAGPPGGAVGGSLLGKGPRLAMKHFDPRFTYVPALATDVAATWRRFGFNPQENERRRAKRHSPVP